MVPTIQMIDGGLFGDKEKCRRPISIGNVPGLGYAVARIIAERLSCIPAKWLRVENAYRNLFGL